MARDIKKLISEMTLEEKASLLGGADFWHTKTVERLGIGSYMLSDGPHGLRKQEEGGDHLGINDSIQAVCFPAACATASSYDRELIYGMGDVIGRECQAENLSTVLGPAVCIKRSPLCGRNFEYMSEDPYLAGEMAAAYINGVQSHHVATSIKHYAANNQETARMSVSAEVSERALREIYLPAFETAVKKAQPKTIMCSYNKINGVYSSENKWLLTDVLRKDWGFEGFVVTDWGAVADRVKGVMAGLDLEMPGNTAENDALVVEAVRSGKLPEEAVDACVERILRVFFDFDEHREQQVFDREKDHAIAAKIEEECAVLLKNDGLLPLRAGGKYLYVGEYAEKPRYQGGGSSHINSYRVDSALSASRAAGRSPDYIKGFPMDSDTLYEEDLAKLLQAAPDYDAVVVFAGLPDIIESEGYDRKDMKLPASQNRLIEALLRVQKNVVVVLSNGAPVELPWADEVPSILEMYLGGEGVGQATDKLLFGEVNPSGHLAETWPMKLSDNPSFINFPGTPRRVSYAEGIYVGYRYYDAKEMPVRYAFGHGLSYTSFEISNLRCDREAFGDGEQLTVRVDVKNTGDRSGKEVVQLYVAAKNGTVARPVKELKGFVKVALQPGETKTVEMTIDDRALSYYDEDLRDWYAPSGEYALLAGDSSDHITAEGTVRFETKKLPYLAVDTDTNVGELLKDPRTAPVFQQLMAARMSAANASQDGISGDEAQDQAMMQAMMEYMPLKSLISFGVMNREQLQGLVQMLRSAL
ncbi:MAG: glycoside hydrolase family 3 C-terminal domain-containing protein [Clostridia bacterium]|nr:glycoside hydrolase family 3 C-terminal domain-containing protein [Clostridia bacterium]